MTSTAPFDWSAVAPSWDQRREHVAAMNRPVVDALLARLQLRPGERVLELSAGTGELSLRLADAVGADGHVISSDVAPGMVALLERTTAHVPSVEVRRLDAMAIDLPDASVDAVVIQMGLMLVERPDAAMREIHRVLAPGGRVAVAVWAGPAENLWLSSVGMAAMLNGVVAGGPPTGPGGIFSLADPAALEQTISGAGFATSGVEEVAIEAHFASTDEHFDTVSALAGPLSVALSNAPDDKRAAVSSMAAEVAEKHRTSAGIVLPGRALVCAAVRS